MKPRSPRISSSSCELCGGRASVYCDSDFAFLCAGCDARVHGANFLAARHIRTPVATSCSGADDSDNACDSASSSSVRSAASSCVSTAESAPSDATSKREPPSRPRSRRPSRTSLLTTGACGIVDARAEGVLAAWCARLVGDGEGGTSGANCAAVVAAHAMGVGLRRLGSAVPPRVCAAASVWFAFKLCCCRAGRPRHEQCLRRLQDCSGVPARIVAAAESKLSRLVRSRQRDAEGWAECEAS